MTDEANDKPLDDDLQKALAAFGDDILDLMEEDDDEDLLTVEAADGIDLPSELEDLSPNPDTSDSNATRDSHESLRDQKIASLLERVEEKFGKESTLGYAGSIAVACSKAVVQPREQESRSIVFSVGELLFALPMESVPEIARCAQITPLPRTADWLVGVASLRGELVTVINPVLLFELPPESQNNRFRHRKLILIKSETGRGNAAFLVDRIAGIHSLQPMKQANRDSQELPQSIVELASDICQWDDRPVVLLDPNLLMSSPQLMAYGN